MNNIVEITDLNYLQIFNNFSLSIDKNKFTSISGPSNSGKTTLLRILDGQIKTEGSIEVNGKKQKDYKVTDYFKIIKAIIPTELLNINNVVEDEINYYIDQLFLSKEEKNKRLKIIYKKLNLTKLKKDSITSLTVSELIRLQIALAIASMPKVILIDDISPFFTTEEVRELVKFFKELMDKYDLTVVLISSRLDDIQETDSLYILSDSSIILKGKPLEVLQKDNVLNRVGIRLPFMIDLSVKLKDYGLIENIELDMNRMADSLWK